ncbi:MAG: Heavy metal efflux outer membrane protein CzcC family [Acidobacteriaceae bacterium]|nr:Heavy metal efflux outer membrane protein CzcC family [Acidobacteriaceae bacterium]
MSHKRTTGWRVTPIAFIALALLVSGGFIAGCKVGPNYKRPDAPMAPSFKDKPALSQPATTPPLDTPPPAGPGIGWKHAQPGDDQIRGKWWEAYGDPQLNTLEERVTISNQTLKAALAQYTEAVAAVRVFRANYFPQVSVTPSYSRTRFSSNRPFGVPVKGNPFTDLVASGSASWEPDLWGDIRRTVQQSRENAQASAADLANAELSIRSELAMDYFELRGLDTQKKLLDDTTDQYVRFLSLTQTRFRGGVATDADVAFAQTQLDQVRAQDIDVGVARAQFEHAIATLTGQPASSFALEQDPLTLTLPTFPVGVPSEMLERRPDVAGAERRAAAANEQIGIDIAAYYPRLNLGGSGGVESARPGNLFQGPSTLWSLGGSATQILFDAGRRHALTDEARAAYDAQTANYRQTVLQSFQDVEDQLAALSILDQEAAAQQQTVIDAERSLSISTNRYKGGLATYLEVIVAQATALTNERTAADITTRQFAASVQLVKALGGGWQNTQLPHP